MIRTNEERESERERERERESGRSELVACLDEDITCFLCLEENTLFEKDMFLIHLPNLL